MEQKYKNIYFSDYPEELSNKKNITIAFGINDIDIYEKVQFLSSQEVREILGVHKYSILKDKSSTNDINLNTYCLKLLRTSIDKLNKSEKMLNSSDDENRIFDPIHTTFRGGENEPLHNWYPYLEGYSPQFVENIIYRYAPNSDRILDPFSGSGTTPITASRLGKKVYYCEVNPLLQFITDIKIATLSMNLQRKTKILSHIKILVSSIESSIDVCSPDIYLKESYSNTFGESEYFSAKSFNSLLKIRSFIDKLSCEDPLLGKILTMSTLSCMLPASFLIRRGDVRFKTKKEIKSKPTDIVELIKSHLMMVSEDIKNIDTINNYPVLICENAREIGKIPELKIDTIITSPPYLNGTNYFRNTKIELWFMRCLQTSKDLSFFRNKAITAGINDVSLVQKYSDLDTSILKIVKSLDKCAYDKRIPHMVASYFSDMKNTFYGIKKHLVEGSTIAIDIGDSSYCGVHVPTDELLINTLKQIGYKYDHQTILRKRVSRDGFPLSQSLLIFKYCNPIKKKDASDNIPVEWQKKWNSFKKELPHQKGEYSKRNWGNSLHSLCSYQGKMKPSLASHLIDTFIPNGGTMLDPFAGVGTIPFEAALKGIKAWGFEISPAAYHISRAKLSKLNRNVCINLLKDLERYIIKEKISKNELVDADKIKFNGKISDYYHPLTLKEILLARRYFIRKKILSPEESLVLASLLHILHGNRPYALSRTSHPITPFYPSGTKEYKSLITSLREKIVRSFESQSSSNFKEGKILLQDATSWWPQEIDNLDAIITSPPFFDSTRFYLANWIRLWFSGWEADDFIRKPMSFIDEKQKVGLEVYVPILRQARERLKKDGVLVMHLGKSKKCDMALELADLASKWFKVYDIFSENVEHCESHGIRDKGTVKSHQYLVLG